MEAISSCGLIPKDGPIFVDDFLRLRFESAKLVLDFIDRNIPDRIISVDQASKLDDAWPIENVWSIVRTKLMKKNYQNLFEVKEKS